jgi:hypothetical protein
MKSIIYGCVVIGALIGAGQPLLAQGQNGKALQHVSASEVSRREAMVFDALDLSRPELAQVAAAWKQKDMAAAEKAFAAYLRNRTTVKWGPTGDPSNFTSHLPTDRSIANDAVAGKFQGGQISLIYPFPNGDMDWRYNATDHEPGRAPDNEWQWQLNRMAFWGDLERAYAATGDERYAKAFVREMHSWIAQSPVPDHVDNVVGSTWRTIEAGIRAGGPWPAAFFAFRHSPSMSDTDLLVLVSGFLDHGNYLRHYNTRLNFLTMEMSGLYGAGALFPEFKEAADWRSFAANHLAEEARTQFLPDGGHDELSTEYQNVALGNILKIPEIARWTGRTAELPAGYTVPLEKAFEYEVSLMAPDRFMPKYNNGLPQYLPTIFKMAVENFPARTDFNWVASDGAEGKQPAFISAFLNRAGEAAMRSGWSRTDNYLGFRLGPIGMGHQHQDKLGVVVWAYGRSLIFNTGGGNYERSKWRTWATSTFGHNCVIIDGMPQNRPTTSSDPWHDPDLISQGPIDGHWQTNSVFDFASGDYAEGYGPQRLRPASQHRDVLFLKPDMYVVADRMRPNDAQPHKYQARWQLLTTESRIDQGSAALVTTDAGQANIAVVPLLTKDLEVASASGQEFPELLGWNVRKALTPQVVPATTLLHTKTGAGPQVLLTLIIPLRPGEANPVAGVTAGQGGRSATVTFTDGRKLLISCPGERGITVDETLPGGKAGRSAHGGTS